ncbi:MAG: bifunctional ADP-dependent NAD(P)H-hydrate dehydratase/NAD(P)H-hydrate epimerase, partial [Candidatus Hydrogenedentes bacterium]|nr:bifunctional ADP-dependent NAD(P)H-hydrate dehydratase/NAD(P)H-hydrate epimerase [Candidatus Hydrogenedentota bacterium]
GTGDVLAGLIGGLMAQGLQAFDAALIGVFLHGLAGDIAAENMTGRAMLAGDLVESLPDAWRVVGKR